MKHPARDFWADWGAATSPDIERNRADHRRGYLALQDMEAALAAAWRKLAAAYKAGRKPQALRLARELFEMEEQYRAAKDRQEELNLEHDRARWGLVIAKWESVTTGGEPTS